MDAARNSAKKDASSMDVSGSIGVSKTSVGGSFNYSESDEHSRKDEAVTGSVNAGGNLNVRAGKDVKVEGADLSAGKNATVKADGKVELKEAVSAEESSKSSFSASGAAEGGRGSKGGRRTKTGDGEQMLGGGGASYDSSSSSSSTVKKTTVTSGGETKVEGKKGASANGAELQSSAKPAEAAKPK
jgi:filamentous hemagglutinin